MVFLDLKGKTIEVDIVKLVLMLEKKAEDTVLNFGRSFIALKVYGFKEIIFLN